MHRVSLALLVVAGFLLFPSSAHAGSILFKSSGDGVGAGGVDLSASALFTIDGSKLTIRLKNTGDSSGFAQDVPGNQLTGVFFDLPTGLKLTPVSATVAPGAILHPSACDKSPCNGTTTNVGGEFAYNTTASGNWGAHHAGDHGIAGSGYIGVNSGNFNGPNLEGTANPNGPNFGIVAKVTADNAFNPNGGLQGVPLIEKEVVFVMNITGSNNKPFTELAISQISNVSFQYGTGFNEPKLPPGVKPPPGVPEPAALLLLAPGLAWAVRRRSKSKVAH